VLIQILLAAALTVVTVFVHAGCTAFTLQRTASASAPHPGADSLWRKATVVAALVVGLLAVHLVEASLWSLTYIVIGAIEDMEKALYFSIVTFTTLGYGDVVPGEGWRVLAALQAAVGILVFGWSTALMVALITRISGVGRSRAP
jgi:voltage-gated potassium channel Kch